MGFERFIYKYYGKSNSLKLKIRLVCKEQLVEIFNKKGDLIYSDEQQNKILKLKNIGSCTRDYDITEKQLFKSSTNGGIQKTCYLTLKGLNKLLMSSRSCEAIN